MKDIKFSRKRKLYDVAQHYLNQLEKGGINPKTVVRKLLKKKIDPVRGFSTKEVSGMISELVRFGRENNIEMRRSF
jgi:predicted transcriptional regulator